ncbi:glycosyl transferase [Acinetobacter tandoii]|uniref:glycosyltransferase family A protein n=1 Tax=Acinetobacter tandoii TaxID=202954 RepID=UPI000C201D96|nr:glycosyltransferase family 2 protein [Acinetobacter tandoii]PJG42964.1 glycosyl transferase [Acinetobacter tandoii]
MIDIIIPTYKPSHYLVECFLSLQNQTLSFDRFKVTVVLNGDKEPYYSYIQATLEKFSFNYSLIYTEEKGVSNARNIGLEITNYPYILFLDDDDILTENYLVQIISRVKPNSVVVSNVFGFLKDINNPIRDYLSFDQAFQSTNLVRYRKYLSNSCCKLIPREIINNSRFDVSLFKGEDALFMFFLSHRISNIISTDPDVIYFRRIRPLSASRTKYSVSKEIGIGLQQQRRYTSLYIRNFTKYSFALYLSRILAVFKVILMKMKG